MRTLEREVIFEPQFPAANQLQFKYNDLRPKQFLDWLLTYNEDDVVGYNCRIDDCPIYRFLQYCISEFRCVSVMVNGVTEIDRTGEHNYFPVWLTRYQETLDRTPRFAVGDPMTRAQVMHLLGL